MTSPLTPEQQHALNELRNAIIDQLDRDIPQHEIVAQLVRDGWLHSEAQAAVQRVAAQLPDKQSALAELQQTTAQLAQDKPLTNYNPDNITYLRTAARTAARQQAATQMWIGAAWAIGGTLVTVISLAAAEGGGTYIIAWGAVLYGIVTFFRGFIAYITGGE